MRLILAALALVFLLLVSATPAFAQIESVATPTGRLRDLGPSDWLAIAALASAPFVLIILWIGDLIRPGSFSRGGVRDVSPHPWWIWLFSGIVIYLATGIGAGLVASIPTLSSGSGLRPLALQSLSAYAVGLAAAWAMLRLLRAQAPSSGLQIRASDVPLGFGWLLLWLPVVAAGSALAVWIVTRATGDRPDALAHETLSRIIESRDDPWRWALVATAVIGASIVEEVVFRAALQSAVLRLLGRTWPAIFVSATLFALVHLSGRQVPLHALVPLWLLGIALGVAYERTKRLGVPIVMHAGFNAANLALALAAAG